MLRRLGSANEILSGSVFVRGARLIYQPVCILSRGEKTTGNRFPQLSSIILPKKKNGGKSGRFSSNYFSRREYGPKDRSFESRVGKGLVLTTLIERKGLSTRASLFRSFRIRTYRTDIIESSRSTAI